MRIASASSSLFHKIFSKVKQLFIRRKWKEPINLPSARLVKNIELICQQDIVQGLPGPIPNDIKGRNAWKTVMGSLWDTDGLPVPDVGWYREENPIPLPQHINVPGKLFCFKQQKQLISEPNGPIKPLTKSYHRCCNFTECNIAGEETNNPPSYTTVGPGEICVFLKAIVETEKTKEPTDVVLFLFGDRILGTNSEYWLTHFTPVANKERST